jgi:HSP20 family molecular chaperone IbpA
MKKTVKNKKVDQRERATEFDEKVKEPEEVENEEDSEGVADGVLKSAGQIIPGLGGLLKGLEHSPAFKERLKRINQEVERRLKEAPLKRTHDRSPHMESGFSTGTLVQEETPWLGMKRKKPTAPPSPQPKEPTVDIFDEEDHLRIIVELPGVAEKNIKTSLEKETLTLRINSAGWKPEHQVTLPYTPSGKLKQVFRNGVLEIQVAKDRK